VKPIIFGVKKILTAVVLVFALGWVVSVRAADADKSRPSIPDEVGETWEYFQHMLQDWGDRFRDRLSGREAAESRPVISEMLSRRDELGLSQDQVKRLEQLRDNFQRQTIRSNADARIVELDIAALLTSPAVDLTKVEAKVREAEKLRADLRIARIKTLEQAKGVLTAEQRKKFYETAESRAPQAPTAQNPP